MQPDAGHQLVPKMFISGLANLTNLRSLYISISMIEQASPSTWQTSGSMYFITKLKVPVKTAVKNFFFDSLIKNSKHFCVLYYKKTTSFLVTLPYVTVLCLFACISGGQNRPFSGSQKLLGKKKRFRAIQAKAGENSYPSVKLLLISPWDFQPIQMVRLTPLRSGSRKICSRISDVQLPVLRIQKLIYMRTVVYNSHKTIKIS